MTSASLLGPWLPTSRRHFSASLSLAPPPACFTPPPAFTGLYHCVTAMPGRFRLRENRLTPCQVQRQLLALYLQFNSSKRFFATEDKVSLVSSSRSYSSSLPAWSQSLLVVLAACDAPASLLPRFRGFLGSPNFHGLLPGTMAGRPPLPDSRSFSSLTSLSAVRVDALEHLAAQHLVVGVQADLDHVVDGPLAPLAVTPSLVEQLEGVVRVARVPLVQRLSTSSLSSSPSSSSPLPCRS